MTEAEDIYKSLFCWFFFSLIWMQSQKNWLFYCSFGGQRGGHILQWAIPCTGIMEEPALLVAFQPTPQLLLALWRMSFLILENMCSPFAQKVLYVPVGRATLVVPAVQWTTRDIGCPEGSDKCSLQNGVWTVHLVQGNWMRPFLFEISVSEQILLFFFVSLVYEHHISFHWFMNKISF